MGGAFRLAPASAGLSGGGWPNRQARRTMISKIAIQAERLGRNRPGALCRPWADRPSRSPADQPDHQNCRHPVQDDGRRAVAGRAHLITTPHGKLPTVMSLRRDQFSVSITLTLSERPFAT